MKPRRAAAIALAALAAIALGGCGGDGTLDDTPVTVGTTFPSVDPSLPTSFGQTFGEGTAHVELTGGFELTLDLPITPQTSVFNEPPAGATITYADTAGNTFAMGGAFVTGPTTTSLVLTITTQQPQPTLLTSLAGECTVTFDEASSEGVTGSFACEGLDAGGTGPTLDATGTFEASV